MMKMAIFDFDGTIADSFPWFVKRINHIAKIFRFRTIDSDDVSVLREMGVDEILKYLGISSVKLPFVIIYMKWLMKREAHQIELFGEVRKLFEALSQNEIKVVILSSNSKKNVKLILKEVSHFVTDYYCGAGLRSKEIKFKEILKKYPRASMISVGDEPRDMVAAQKVNLKHLNVSWGYASEKAFENEEVVPTFSDLKARILRHFESES